MIVCVCACVRACVCVHVTMCVYVCSSRYAIVIHSYTAEPGELHEFSEDKEPLLSVLNGDLHHTHKLGMIT